MPDQIVKMLSQELQVKRTLRPCTRTSCRTKAFCNSSRSSKVTLLDIRQKNNFDKEHMCGSLSSPLKQLTETTGDIFADSNALRMYWTNLRAKFADEATRLGMKSSTLMVLCYDGETSRLAVSILRAQGYTAFSVFGGYSALVNCVKARK
jgi:rhodanese-related sulfurtransferase